MLLHSPSLNEAINRARQFSANTSFKSHERIVSNITNTLLLYSSQVESSINMKTIARVTKNLNENDILLGRGGKNNQWVGNEKLRNIARRRCHEYQKASKKGKSQVSREIVEKIRRMKPPGR